MADNDIPKHDIVPIDHVAEGIEGLRIAFVNVFGIRHTNDHWTLIDAGVPYSATLIRTWSEKHFEAPPVAIILTHGHFDHVSSAGELADLWDVPIYAHELEAPYLTGEKEYPPPNMGAGGGLMSLLSPMYPRGPVSSAPDLGRRPGDRSASELADHPYAGPHSRAHLFLPRGRPHPHCGRCLLHDEA